MFKTFVTTTLRNFRDYTNSILFIEGKYCQKYEKSYKRNHFYFYLYVHYSELHDILCVKNLW